MNMHDLLDQLSGYFADIRSRPWHVILTAWCVACIGWIGMLNIPDRYQAAARVYVDSQSLLRPLLSGITVQPNVNEQVTIMANTLISRPNLEKVARMTDMDLLAKTPAQMEGVIADLNKNLTLKSTGYGDLYTIAYENRNPALARKVVQALLTIFVENGLGSSRKDLSSSQKFIEEQLKDYEIKLETAENALKNFKIKNAGLMPGEMGQDYFSKISDMQDQMRQTEMELHEAENRRDSYKRQLSGEDPTLLTDAITSSNTPEIDARIESLKKNLDTLRLKYTDQYPDIVATKNLIDELEASKKKESRSRKPLSGSGPSTLYQQLNVSLVEATAQAEALKGKLDSFRSQYAQLRGQANRIPEVESEYAQLTRNYDIYKKNYETLLSRGESAKLSGEMQNKTDIVDFKVIDPPRVPLTPSFPNRPLLASIILLGALACGLALTFLIGQIKPLVRSKKNIESITDFPLLGIITLIETPQSRALKHRGRIFQGVSLGGLFVVYAGIMTKYLMSAAQ
ncbi:XrtA system polysaccharide chain length determinant [Ferrovum sp.]|uniref:XrtA system polysaccharide chain length determinant n=3 Tax=Ferrovum sp. TaxID=2609467 RepID=UPI00262B3D1F|nr:XrtA system polysaccharide chain length determinant [Ferrovum sp.]